METTVYYFICSKKKHGRWDAVISTSQLTARLHAVNSMSFPSHCQSHLQYQQPLSRWSPGDWPFKTQMHELVFGYGPSGTYPQSIISNWYERTGSGLFADQLPKYIQHGKGTWDKNNRLGYFQEWTSHSRGSAPKWVTQKSDAVNGAYNMLFAS